MDPVHFGLGSFVGWACCCGCSVSLDQHLVLFVVFRTLLQICFCCVARIVVLLRKPAVVRKCC